MSKAQLDKVIHSPIRLQICALLMPLTEAEFKKLASELEVSDSVLSKHIKQLIEAKYVKQRKEPFDSSSRTWIKLTTKGRIAFEGHINELKMLISSTVVRQQQEIQAPDPQIFLI